MDLTREKIIHLLKVGVWLELKKGNRGLEWKHFYMCGSHVMASAKTKEDLRELIKKLDAPLFPKIIYSPPRAQREMYFEPVGEGTGCSEAVHLSFATAIMPAIVDSSPVETYDISPYEIAYVTASECYQQFMQLLMTLRRMGFYLPRDLKYAIYQHLVSTSNRGFTTALPTQAHKSYY